MIKNLSILIVGILIGGGAMFFAQSYQDLKEENALLRMSSVAGKAIVEKPELKLDSVIEQLVKEELEKSKEKSWFDEKLKAIGGDNQRYLDKLNLEGEEAAKIFKKFSDKSLDNSAEGN